MLDADEAEFARLRRDLPGGRKRSVREVPLIRRRPETDDEEEDNVSFLRQFCICEEDRISRTGEMRTGLNGPRWFRSENVIPIERARARVGHNRV